MSDETLSLGEYIRRLRRAANRPLTAIAEETGISYTHLSRIENDSKVPNADSLVKIADALGGDLQLMLGKRNALSHPGIESPAAATATGGRTLRRSAPKSGVASDEVSAQDSEVSALAADLSKLDPDEAAELRELIAALDPTQRHLIRKLILAMQELDGAKS